jgi:outer membrane receptor protein involved in Fe transport
MKRLGRLAASLLLTLVSTIVFAQNPVISGKVTSSSGENNSRISVSIKGTKVGSTTDDNGNYSVSVPSSIKFPVTLVFSGVGVVSQELVVKSPSDKNDITINVSTTMADEIVVSATRTQTRALESPVTIERVGLNTIRSAPSANYYDIVGNMKGVDMVASSLTFKTVTTRGFNGSGNLRFTQIVDGMDNQAPGLNFAVGSVIGLSELDVESMELLPGASSALYGPGGMNGTLLINSKNPFKFQGLSFQVKQGMMNTDSRYRPTSMYSNWSLRWGQKISDKLAF